jgi:hypothetical protein
VVYVKGHYAIVRGKSYTFKNKKEGRRWLNAIGEKKTVVHYGTHRTNKRYLAKTGVRTKLVRSEKPRQKKSAPLGLSLWGKRTRKRGGFWGMGR